MAFPFIPLQLPEKPGFELMLRSGKGEIGVFFTDTSIENLSQQQSSSMSSKGSLFSTGSIFTDSLMGDIKPLLSSSKWIINFIGFKSSYTNKLPTFRCRRIRRQKCSGKGSGL